MGGHELSKFCTRIHFHDPVVTLLLLAPEGETSSFDGESYIEFDMSRQAVQTTQDLLEMRFRTGKPDGVLFYASGNQGDLMMMEMSRGYLKFKLDLGK